MFKLIKDLLSFNNKISEFNFMKFKQVAFSNVVNLTVSQDVIQKDSRLYKLFNLI